MPKCSEVRDRRFRHSDFVIPSDFVIRHSSFITGDASFLIRHLTGGLILSSRTKNAQRWAAS
jgi:hypothetical protein